MQGKQLILHARQAQTDHIVVSAESGPEIDQIHRRTDARGVQDRQRAFRIGRLFCSGVSDVHPRRPNLPY